jgi:hypothetical protein
MSSVGQAAPEPSQGGSSLEAKLDEQHRLNVPRLPLNDGHSLPQLDFGAWQIDNADAPEIPGTAIHAGYRLIHACECRKLDSATLIVKAAKDRS